MEQLSRASQQVIDAHYQLASMKWKHMLTQGQMLETIKDIQSYIEDNESQPTSFFGIGNKQEKEGICLDNEIQWYFEEIRINQEMNNPYDLLSLLSSCLESYQQAIEWYKKLLEERPTCFKLHFGLANVYYNNHQCRIAENYYKEAVKINPNFAQGYVGLAWIEIFRYLRFHKALQYAQKAIIIANTNFHAKLIMAGFHPSLQKSKALLEELKISYPQNPLILCAQGYRFSVSCYNRERIQEIYMNALKIKNKAVAPYIYMAKLLNYEGENEKAREYLQEAAIIHPRNHLIYLERGYLQYYDNKYELALEYLQKTQKLNAEDSYLLYLTGCIYKDCQSYVNLQKALLYFQRCIKFNPFYLKAYSKIREIYQSQDQMEDQLNSMFGQISARLQFGDQKGFSTIPYLFMKILAIKRDAETKEKLYSTIEVYACNEFLSLMVGEELINNDYVSQGIRYLKLALSINAYCESASTLLAKAYQSIEKWHESIEQYLYSLRQFESELSCSQIDGICSNILRVSRHFPIEQSVIWLQQASKIGYYNLDFLMTLGQYYEKCNRFKEAMSIYNRIEDNDSSDSNENKQESQLRGKSRKWQAVSMMGIYSKTQKLYLNKYKLLFKSAFHRLFISDL